MRLFFHASSLQNGKIVTFDLRESKHITRVLRMKKGDRIHMTCGDGQLFQARIIDEDKRECKVEVVSSVAVDEPGRPYFRLLVAPPRSKQRWEWLLEKVTEIGVDEILPIHCEQSERATIDPKRANLVLINALKQSQQVRLPLLHPICPFYAAMEGTKDGLRLIAHCNENKDVHRWNESGQGMNTVNILIGPEGDFTPDEVNKAIKNDYFALSLGENRLRTETAAIVASQMVASMHRK
jgi:16S rRNA (uracil1498-N3)-methyltransferase